MNVLILSDYSRFAADLNSQLRRHGFNSVLLTTKQVENDEGILNVSVFKSKRLITLLDHARAFLYRKILLRSKGVYFQDVSENGNYYSIGRIRRRISFKPDAVIIVFDYRMVTGRTIADLYQWTKAKIIWLMVDMKPFTGGCAYSGACVKYTTGCDRCPLIGNLLFQNYAHTTLEKRKRLLSEVELQPVAGSSYQLQQACSSYLFSDRKIEKMYFPNDEAVFKYGGRRQARETLNLPPGTKIILFGANRFDAEVKGYKFLLEALKILRELTSDNEVMLMTVGNGALPVYIEQMYRVRGLGWVTYETLSLAYQAADVFVSPSIEDSGPLMVNQSLMCGTPVVAFKMGVSIDLVSDSKTGYLAELRDSRALAEGILKILALSPQEKDKVTAACLKASEQLGYRPFIHGLRALLK